MLRSAPATRFAADGTRRPIFRNLAAAAVSALAVLGASSPVAAVSAPPVPVVAQSAVAANATTGAWIDTWDRGAVLSAYQREFSKVTPAAGWSGDRDACAAGTTSASYRAAIFERINFFRSMAGVPATVTEDPALSAKAQTAALMMSVTGRLSHVPDSSFGCFTQTGVQAAGSSNLHLGRTGPEAITDYVHDFGTNNASVGHRNWILHPPVAVMGSGDLPASGGRASNALWVMEGAFAANPAMRQSDGWVAWPNEGYVPGELVFPRWSFSLDQGDFSGASVTVSAGGQALPVSVEFQTPASKINYAPNPSIVWNVPGVSTNPTIDTAYEVTVRGVKLNGVSRTYTYTVVIMGEQAALTSGEVGDLEAFVDRAHRDFLGRSASAAELSAGVSRLSNGTSRYTYVLDLAASSEWTAHVVDDLYLDTLGRGGDVGGRTYWVGRLQQGMTVAQVAASFYGSPEYVANEGGEYYSWLLDLYGELLARTPDAGGISFWVGQAQVRGSSSVAYDFYQSKESRQTRVIRLYQTFLGRNPDAGGLEFWSERLADGNDLALAAQLAASDEYFRNS